MDHRAGGISEPWPGLVALSREDGRTRARRRGALSRSRHLLALAAHAPAAGAGSPSHLQHRQPAAGPASARPSRPSSWAPVWGLREAGTGHGAGGLARSPRPERSVAEPSLSLVQSQFKIQCPCELSPRWTSALSGNRLRGWGGGTERGPGGGIPARVCLLHHSRVWKPPACSAAAGAGAVASWSQSSSSSLAPRCPAPLDRLCGFTAAAGAGGSDNGA